VSAVISDQATHAPSRRTGWPRRLTLTAGGRIGLVVLALLVAASAASALGALPHLPAAQHPDQALRPPSGDYWLGTDQFGRDVLARVVAGLQLSLQISVAGVVLATVVGTLAGIGAGFVGGWLEIVVLRCTDILFAIPSILLALAIVTALGHGWVNSAIAVGIAYIPIFIRVVRGPVLALRGADFILAGRVLGFSTWRLLFRHVLPNVSGVLVVQVTLALAWAFLTEASLSFLGLGPPAPAASLGKMVSESTSLAATAWWTLAGPAVTIVLAVIGLNLLGDALRDVLDPRSGERRN
jgi:peptide/nickel transport system permease protein